MTYCKENVYTITLEDHIKIHVGTLNYVYVDTNMVLSLFYYALSAAVFMWHQQDKVVTITNEW
jgi:hypothetical protein